MRKISSETRICKCGCEETFECKTNSKQKFIHGHSCKKYLETIALWKDIEQVVCQLCQKRFRRITNTHLKYSHGITEKEYGEMFPNIPMIAEELKKRYADTFRGKSYEEIYGREQGEELRKRREESAIKQMKNLDQIEIRRRKLKKIQLWKTYRERAIKHYGLKCQICNRSLLEEEVDVHHKDGKNFPNAYGNHSVENLMVLCRSCHSKIAPKYYKVKGDLLVEKAAAEMLSRLGLDITNDPNLKDTPRRIAALYEEVFSGLKEENRPYITFFPNEKSTKCDQIVMVKANFMSMCSHHFMPFFGEAFFGYIPGKQLIGLSKIKRVIDYFANRPQLQEKLTQEVVDFLDEKIHPKGCMLVMKAMHMCVAIKDRSQLSAQATTSAVKGCFKETTVKNEFLSLINSTS